MRSSPFSLRQGRLTHFFFKWTKGKRSHGSCLHMHQAPHIFKHSCSPETSASQRAVKHKLKPEDMIRTLFIFSDMEFDQCITMQNDSQLSSRSHKPKQRDMTNFEAVKVYSKSLMPCVFFCDESLQECPVLLCQCAGVQHHVFTMKLSFCVVLTEQDGCSGKILTTTAHVAGAIRGGGLHTAAGGLLELERQQRGSGTEVDSRHSE